MKNIIKITTLIFTLAFFVGCQDDDVQIGDITAPSNLTITAEVLGVDADNPNGDGSGLVKLTASADNALSYNFQFGDGLEAVVPSGIDTHRYSIVGLNTYTVVVSAIGSGGIATTQTIDVEVFSSFDDLEAKELLSGGIGSSKTWYLDASVQGHLGVGGTMASAPDSFWFPSFYAAQPFEKCGDPISDCLCDDVFTFSLDASEQLTFELDNNGQTFFNAGHQGVIGENAGEDACFDFDTSGTSVVSLSPTAFDWSVVPDPDFNGRGTSMNFSGGKFMGYYVSSSTYEIIEVTNSSLYVRTIDGNDPGLYWYHKFTTTLPSEEFNSIYNDLDWSDEFDINGAPNSENWTYDLGAGGWGNSELQTYTNNAENVIVEDGFLKITAKADGSGYTSARLKSENLYEFTYGRVEVRAKLPAATGTWPAIWSLGADYETNTWPGCGEMDIMEQKGQDKNTVLATVHHPAVSPGAGDSASTVLTTSTTEFHNYTMEWTPDTITFLVDDNVFHTIVNSPDLPFESDFFLIMNVAMGGTLGGTVDPGFTQDSMEIDYVRVYK
ncbi:family 16 glycosylhydrolase [Psychroserpens sp. Hel_I_66]|uniref:family 16 glycosylhydrolase n=1 Tax=Psychroserpens sp. Hel_I_66 TaxID=1250004 RepID=UPI0006482B09|nr:family 16 glycosylhydrolase [Psychroserpens sp. Hel_I_66]